jgi:hypothetical protein
LAPSFDFSVESALPNKVSIGRQQAHAEPSPAHHGIHR